MIFLIFPFVYKESAITGVGVTGTLTGTQLLFNEEGSGKAFPRIESE